MSNAGGLGSDTTFKVVGVSLFKLLFVFVLGFLTRGYLVVFDHEFQDYVEGTSSQRPQQEEEDRNKPPPKQQQHQQQQHHDILSHLPKCDQPQSPLSLAELAAKYRPSKFVRYAHTNFDRIYPQYLEPYRFKQFRMLEIGLDTGAGSLLWSEYFPCGVLYGLEYTERESHTPGARRITTVTGDQGNRTFLQTEFLAQTDGGHFDVIIDDGGHHYEQQSLSYEVLFARALTPGGLYFIEDIETSYWQPGVPLYNNPITRGGYAEPDTMINRFKLVIDVVNKKFFDNTYMIFGPVDYWIATLGFMSNLIILTKKDRSHCLSEMQYIWPDRLAMDCPARDQTPHDAVFVEQLATKTSSFLYYCGQHHPHQYQLLQERDAPNMGQKWHTNNDN